ncbi:MAG: HAD-IA family hydrolase [Limnothrix sp.]
MKKKPKVIFFDAVGTLIGVKEGVGKTYANIAEKHGVEVAPDVLEQAFRAAFKESRAPIFPGVDSFQIPEKEFQWWEAIANKTFTEAGVIDQFEDFPGFFTQLYAHFATPDPWFVFPDVLSSIQTWHSQGIELGLISNFDSRLYAIIELLDLKQYLTSITISSIVGAAKPDRTIFLSALDKHNCQASQTWHIGDSKIEDYDGASRIGMTAFLLQRSPEERFPYSRQEA